MKKKRTVLTLASAVALSVFMAATSFAGEWQTNEYGWQYQKDDGTYAEWGWNWIDGKCYYFEPVYRFADNAVCELNKEVNLCYRVNESGALVINGTVIEEGSEMSRKLINDNFSGYYEGGTGAPEIDICGIKIEQTSESGEIGMYRITSASNYDEYVMDAESNYYYGTAMQTLDENGNPMLVLAGANWLPIARYKIDGNTLTFITNDGQYTYQKQ